MKKTIERYGTKNYCVIGIKEGTPVIEGAAVNLKMDIYLESLYAPHFLDIQQIYTKNLSKQVNLSNLYKNPNPQVKNKLDLILDCYMFLGCGEVGNNVVVAFKNETDIDSACMVSLVIDINSRIASRIKFLNENNKDIIFGFIAKLKAAGLMQ